LEWTIQIRVLANSLPMFPHSDNRQIIIFFQAGKELWQRLVTWLLVIQRFWLESDRWYFVVDNVQLSFIQAQRIAMPIRHLWNELAVRHRLSSLNTPWKDLQYINFVDSWRGDLDENLKTYKALLPKEWL